MTSQQIAVALRVLTAINNRENPDEQDLLLLCLYCPNHADLESDELACMVIQRALEERKLQRQDMLVSRTA
jgi:hypothetical protein